MPRLPFSTVLVTSVLLVQGAALAQPGPDCPAPLPVVAQEPTSRRSVPERREVFAALTRAIETRYVYPDYGGLDWPATRREFAGRLETAPNDQAFWALMKELVLRLGDEHSEYLTPEEARLEDAGGSGRVGIGAMIDPDAQGRRVSRVLPSGPAERAGVRRGDLLIAVEGDRCMPPEQVQGLPGTTVHMTFRSPDGRERSLPLVREAAQDRYHPVARRLGQGGRIGYLELQTFTGNVADEVQLRLEELLGTALNGLIVDLRANAGGFAPQVRRVLGQFVTGAVARRVGRDGSAQEMVAIDGALRDRLEAVPLVLLIDHASASAAELFAGSLQQRGRARVVGTRSAANTEGVSAYDLPDGSRLWLADMDLYLLDGRRLGECGVQPDLEVDPDWTRIGSDQDPVILRAVELLESPASADGQGRKEAVASSGPGCP
ncbi:C-terminal peptidase prc [Deinobacterium chartae]|uniref:C-terminal peptidase prc n=1 Tax=Deinobacterium chartae TaxID=521158 RepID=A0A841HTH7_9DEIO|nr:S41 family peptidase [Deinobacterium chartae]MBB6096657.1 C-terminal peptidase prc [Deinobacterium chartae]